MDPTSDRIAKRIQLRGRVQGVYFRAAAQREAEMHGLTGWAHNDPDGSVTIVVEGDSHAIDDFVDWCNHGPPDARVARVEISEETCSGQVGFHIR